MRRALLLPFFLLPLLLLPGLLLLGGCGQTAAEPPAPGRPAALPDVALSWVAGPAGAREGGEVVVGILVPTPATKRLVELLPPEAYAAFLADEAKREGPGAEPATPDEDVVVESDWPPEGAQAASRRAEALAAASARLWEETGVRFRFQAVQADECQALPLVLADARVREEGDREALRPYLQAGGRLCVASGPEHDMGDHVPGVLPAAPEGIGPLVEACREALEASPLILRLAHDPTRVVRARRDGARVLVTFAARPASARLEDLAAALVAEAAIDADGTVSVVAPDPALDPHAHRIVLAFEAQGATLGRAYTLAELVGALERHVIAPKAAEAGATFAAHVLFRYGSSRAAEAGSPAPGVRERVALLSQGRVLAEQAGETNAAGGLDVALPVPADAPAGAATLVVGQDEFPVTIRGALRVHVTTERPIYRPTDVVHVRVMVHEPSAGRPVAQREVRLKLGDTEQRVTTSAHGIASATFRLFEGRPGPMKVEARTDGADADAEIVVRAFETPTFAVRTEPGRLVVRPGETAPFTLVARYVNDTPLVGAQVRGWAEDGLLARGVEGATDAEGRFEATIGVRARSPSGRYRLQVRDADGRWVDHVLAVVVEEAVARPEVSFVPVDDPVVGVEGAVRLRASVPGTYRVQLPGEAAPREVVVGADGTSAPLAVLPATEKTTLRVVLPDASTEERVLEAAAWDGVRPLLVVGRKTALVGETLAFEVRGADGPVQVDVGRADLMLRAFSVTVADGRARVELPLASDLGGVLTLRAWRFGAGAQGAAEGSTVRVLVTRGRALDVTAQALRDDYRPAETAEVDVTVTDREGRPTAAVLGYWGVDEALLLLRPWERATEEVFDVIPPGADRRVTDLALDVERRRPADVEDLRRALGSSKLERWTADLAATVHASAVVRAAEAEAAATKGFRAAFAAARTAWLAAFAAVPLEEIRTASSLREQTRFLLAGGWLEAGALRDPWGTPLSIGHEPVLERIEERRSARSWSWQEVWGIPCRSAGPDLCFGTDDDLRAVWEPYWIDEVPGRLGRFLAHVEAHAEGAGPDWTARVPVAPFWGPANHGLIGLGGGAGGAFGGRGGGRYLTAGGGGKQGVEDGPVHVRRDFDPTLCFVPEAIVGPDGQARLAIPLKDSITTWRLRLVASALDGATGVGEGTIRVTQPLHAEPWIAPHLTVGDELELPVAIRNETDGAFDASIDLALSPELEAVGETHAAVRLGPAATGAHVFRLRAVRPGSARVRVDTAGGGERDAIERIVTVHRLARAEIDAEGGGVTAEQAFVAALPPLATKLPTDRRVSIYPTPMSETLGGLEGLIACPHG